MFGADALVEGRYLIDGKLQDAYLEVSEGVIRRVRKSVSGTPTHSFPGKLVLPAALAAR